MLYVLKSIGPRVFEDTFNPSAKNGIGLQENH
jgi:hypothetical protein